MKLVAPTATAVAVLLMSTVAGAQAPAPAAAPEKPAVVLVHGAFADASGWSKVIPLLESAGYSVTAVQIPLTSLADDVAAARRVVDAQKGKVVLVGHSYGGAVITGAGAGSDKVKALVYVAAFGPDGGEPVGAFLEKYPAPLGTALAPDAAGFLYIDRAKFHDVFAKDLPETDARVYAATQKPLFGKNFEQSVPTPAWKSVPSWYLVAQETAPSTPTSNASTPSA